MPNRYRVSNRIRSGDQAHLIGKSISWEENRAYADPASVWTPMAGKIIMAGKDRHWVEENTTAYRYWVGDSYDCYRNVRIAD